MNFFKFACHVLSQVTYKIFIPSKLIDFPGGRYRIRTYDPLIKSLLPFKFFYSYLSIN
jgi:hypothetical protein